MSKQVPETIKKQKKRSFNSKEVKQEKNEKRTKLLKEIQEKAYKRAEKYEKEYLEQDQKLKELKQKALKEGSFYREPEPKLAFIIRIRGIVGVPPKPRKILQLLRLRRIYSGVFIRLNKSSLRMLHFIDPYVTWGYPDVETVRALIYKRGHARVNHQRKIIDSNEMIYDKLQKYDIVCMEDLVHEIFTVGKNFKHANSFLWAFKLKPPVGGFSTVKKSFVNKGEHGNREQYINTLVKKMI
ncbi:60S ribosomal protein L7 [Anaeramoeba flamelloides]|uniref:60S ribosomal protein L7 n=1 Tax=Anaeramoeba flamelloides TaxID=1746091 RepID=A0AAV7YL73_9EUKA|nr:60S ribosomal protein L7 [Anaeramoeba flamelloides]KAJ6247316.1 60S ribosomal protein L7 [Anaeramoeba flamelloides]